MSDSEPRRFIPRLNGVSASGSTDDDVRFRHLVRSITEYAVYMWIPYRHLTIESRAERAKGYTRDEIVGRAFLAVLHIPEAQASGRPAHALVLHGPSEIRGRGLARPRDGSRFWASVVLDPMHDQNGRPWASPRSPVITTETRAAQELLPSDEQHLQLLMDSIVAATPFPHWMPPVSATSGTRVPSAPKGTRETKSRPAFLAVLHGGGPGQQQAAHALAHAQANGRFEARGWRVRKMAPVFLRPASSSIQCATRTAKLCALPGHA